MSDEREPARRSTSLQSGSNPYDSSDAPNYNGAEYQINPRTGTLQVSLSPPPLFGFLGDAATPAIQISQDSSLLNRQILHLPLGWLYQYSFILDSKIFINGTRSYFIDPLYESGMRYYTLKDVRYLDLPRPQEFPYDENLSYTSMLRFLSGNHQYFDAYGRLIGMDDRFGNHAILYYDRDGDVVTSKISRLVDSWGQTTQFTYLGDRITIAYPRSERNNIEFSFLFDDASQLTGYVDPLGQRTSIESQGGVVRDDLVSRIVYPNGLEVEFDYGALRFCVSEGVQPYYRMDCVIAVYSKSANMTRAVTYDFDPDDTSHNFTGYPRHCVEKEEDGLLESSDNDYRYRVRVDDGVLVTEHVYNRLHLELETSTMTRDAEAPTLLSRIVSTYPGEGTDESFPSIERLRNEFPNFQTPSRVLSEAYGDDGQSRQHIVETDLDDYGRTQEIRAYRSDSIPEEDALLWTDRTTYDDPTDEEPDRYGLVLKQERLDYTQASSEDIVVRRTVNTLTTDRKNIETTATAFVVGSTFDPTKQTRFEYDARGRTEYEECSWIDGADHEPQSSQTWIDYQEQLPDVIVTTRNVLGQETTRVLDSATGWLATAVDAVGSKSRYTYDDVGRVLTQTDPLEVVTRRSYDDKGGKVTTTFANGYETYAYQNIYGEEIATADNGLSGGKERTLSSMEYNDLGQLVWSEGVLGKASRLLYYYDDRGLHSETKDGLGNTTTYKYNAVQQSKVTKFNGYRIRKTVALDEVIRDYSYSTLDETDYVVSRSISNGFNQLATGRLEASLSAAWVETRYEYDAWLDLRRYEVWGPEGLAGTHRIDRDLFGNVSLETLQTSDGAEATGDLARYNELNQLVMDRNQLGQAAIYTYDPAGRQKTSTDYSGTIFSSRYRPNNQVQLTFFEDEAGQRVEKRFGYDPLTHNLTSIEEFVSDIGQGAIHRSYLRDGSLKRVTYPDGKMVKIVYDERNARVLKVIDVLGNTTRYGYDYWGRLDSAEMSSESQSVRFDYYDRTEDPANSGRLKSSTTSSGLRRAYRYDGFGSVERITFSDVRTGQSQDLFTMDLRYAMPARNLAEIVCRSSLQPDDPALNRRLEYSYNSLNQLTRQVDTNLADGSTATIEYEYDAANNVKQETQTDAAGSVSVTTYSYDADNKLLHVEGPGGGFDLQYDENGNLRSDGLGATYQYNRKGMLTEYSNDETRVECSYTYYPNELRASKQGDADDSIRFYYDGSTVPDIVNETQSESSVSYLQAGGERLLRFVRSPGETVQQHLVTGAKDVTATLKENLTFGTIYDYSPYGAQSSGPSESVDISTNPFQYTRQYTDAESGLIYLRSRFYHPGLKRFITRDTATVLNRYNYGDGNPVNGADPTGEIFGIDDFLIGVAVSAVIGAAIGAAIGGVTTRTWKGAGLGALSGAVGGAVAFGVGSAITFSIAAAGINAAALGPAAGLAVGAGTGALSGAAGGAAGQGVANAAGDHGDIGQAALTGALFGAVTGGVTGFRATFRITNRSIGSNEGIQAAGRQLPTITIGGRQGLIEDIDPAVLFRLPHDTLTWSRIASAIRQPGGLHEWFPVQHFPRARAMGYSFSDLTSNSMRSQTATLELRMSGGSWVSHNASHGHAFINDAVGSTQGVFAFHRAIRALSNRVRVNTGGGNFTSGIEALPDAFRGPLPPISRLIRMPFSIAFGVQGRVWLRSSDR